MPPEEIFARSARRQARTRVAAEGEDRWLLDRMEAELLDRLDAVKRDFASALVIGRTCLAEPLSQRGIAVVRCDTAGGEVDLVCDEDRLALADGCVDLIVSVGVLDTVNDVPGALVLARRVLRPGGLFLAAMMGAGSLASLRQCFPGPAARFHPQIDVRAAGDLLGRAGFLLPVADQDNVAARYAAVDRLFADLRANGLRNCLADRTPLSRLELVESRAAFAAQSIDGKTSESFNLIYLIGWAPEASNRTSGAISG